MKKVWLMSEHGLVALDEDIARESLVSGYPTRLEAAYAAYDRARQEMCEAQNKVAKAWEQFTICRDET